MESFKGESEMRINHEILFEALAQANDEARKEGYNSLTQHDAEGIIKAFLDWQKLGKDDVMKNVFSTINQFPSLKKNKQEMTTKNLILNYVGLQPVESLSEDTTDQYQEILHNEGQEQADRWLNGTQNY